MTRTPDVPYTAGMIPEKKISSTELDRRPGETVLEVVRTGRPTVVTRHGTPVVRLVPIPTDEPEQP